MDEPKVRKTLYGCESSNTCAFCAYHGKALTPAQMKKHRCLGKQCTALIKHEHPIWVEREKKKEVRRARKRRLDEKYNDLLSKVASADRSEVPVRA